MADFDQQEPELSLDELLSDAAQYIDDPADYGAVAPTGGTEPDAPAASYFNVPDALVPADAQDPALPDFDASVFDDAPDAPQTADDPADDFSPDFGSAFDDYGAYEGGEPDEPELPVQRTAKKKRRHLKKFKFPALLKLAIYFAVVVLLGVLLANVVWDAADDVIGISRPDLEVEVRINPTDTLDDIAATLKSVGAIRSEWLFKTFCHVRGCEDYFDPGVYTINLRYDYNALVNNLMASSGVRKSVTVMIIEGLSCDEIFTLLDEQGVCSKSALEQCAAEYRFDDFAFLDGLPYGDVNRLEGYLFPDTYEFYLNDEPERVITKMLRNFDNKLDEDLMERVEASGYTLHEIITMASIIEGEAANDGERPLVASVIFNRLNNWDYPLLNMDSTINYAVELTGEPFSVDLNSPYNTYRYPGLPKGPINNPGLSSIRAVLYAEDTDYYYFATGTDGLNHFFVYEADFNAFINSDEFIGNR